MEEFDVVIIGCGSAGASAAIACYDEGVKNILLIDKNPFPGGVLQQCIHSGFGLMEYKEELTGPEFFDRLFSEVNKRNIQIKVSTYVSSITKDKEVTYKNLNEGEKTIKAKAIIVATGCYERNAGSICLPGSRISGVMTAGFAQTSMNLFGRLPGKKVFILGSGDIGLIMARRFTLEGAKVLGVAELMPYSNGLNRNIQQCLIDYNIPLYLSTTVTRVIGKSRLTAVEISKVDEKKNPIPGTQKIIKCDTLCLSVGLVPYSQLLKKAGAKLAKNNGAIVNESNETSIDGIFTCGNVLHVHDLVDYVCEEGRVSGKAAAQYVINGRKKVKEIIEVLPGDNVGYVVPHYINKNYNENVKLKFRVKSPLKNKKINIYFNDERIISIQKSVLLPSLMENISVKPEFLEKSGKITVKVED